MQHFLARRSAAAASLIVASALFAGQASAQEQDCAPPGATFPLGSETSVVWRMRAGFTCSMRVRIGYRHAIQSISVTQRPQFGQAGASTDRGRDEAGRTTLRIAYMSPAKARAGEDAFTVRVVTRNKESGEILTTVVTYRMELWRN